MIIFKKKKSDINIYIPKDLDDCIKTLNYSFGNQLKKTAIQDDEKSFRCDTHHTIGQSIRNDWGLWKGSRLSKYFNSLGITHPDDMSSIIFTSYHRTIKSKSIDLEKQIEFYKEYWRKSNAK